MLRKYSEIGYEILRHWGFEDGGDLQKKIRSMKAEDSELCVIVALLSEIKLLGYRLEVLDSKYTKLNILELKKNSTDNIANAMLKVLSIQNGDTPIDQMDLSRLSTRARKILIRSKVTLRSEITREKMAEYRNCGEKTITELIRWAGESVKHSND